MFLLLSETFLSPFKKRKLFRKTCYNGLLGQNASSYFLSLTVRAWQHAYNKICTLSCTFHSPCWTDKEGGQRGEIKCHNESKRHNSFWSKALRDESCSGEPFWPLMALLTARKRMRRDWRAHINSNYSQRMRSCKWPTSQWCLMTTFSNKTPTLFSKCPLRLFFPLWRALSGNQAEGLQSRKEEKKKQHLQHCC